jgi:hypothetical protein
MGVLRLSKSYGDARLESACTIALQIKLFRVAEVAEILRKGLDQKQPDTPQGSIINTKQTRGAAYFINSQKIQSDNERTGS